MGKDVQIELEISMIEKSRNFLFGAGFHLRILSGATRLRDYTSIESLRIFYQQIQHLSSSKLSSLES